MSGRARTHALRLVAVFGAAVVMGALFFVVTDPGIQFVDAEELASRRSDAVRFFTFDFVFIVVYALAGPVALWRFGGTVDPATAGPGRVPPWLAIGVVALAAAGLFDAIENLLLLSASSSGDASTVRLAHLLAVPKYAFAVTGLVLALRAVALAVRVLRERS